jgi:hypothetical protein
MSQFKKYFVVLSSIFIIYAVILYFSDFFKIGLLSDDYMNFFGATHSTLIQKFTSPLPFTNPLHFRPAYYVSLQVSNFQHGLLGFNFDNFILYRIQNLVIFFITSFLAGWIILHETQKVVLALAASLAIILFPNNIHNICWTAGRVDLLCGMFYLAAFFFSIKYFNKPSKQHLITASLFFVLALMSKETALTFPFIIIIFLLFIKDAGSFKKYKLLPLVLFIIFGLYLLYRFAELNPGFARYYQMSYFGVLLKSIISLTLPFDYLSLKLDILSGDILTIIYLLVTIAGLVLILYSFIKEETYKLLLALSLLLIFLVSPYLYAGYIRPQMILIPFALIIIFLIISLNRLDILNKNKFSKSFLIWIVLVFAFWLYYSLGTTGDWVYAYNNSRTRMDNLLKINFTPEKNTIIVGNAGRFRQSFMFDKLTGAYGFWRNEKFAIKDTINDIVQTGALDKISIDSKLKYRVIQPGEFEISTTGSTQYFFMEGFEDEKSKWQFSNKDMSVKAINFNYLNKPSIIILKILSQNADCYLAEGISYIKIY